MRFKARSMNTYMRASNLSHIPDQIAWNATKRGVQATRVKSAYSSQECSVCHYVDRKNRPDQGTFLCVVCGHTTHADLNASMNIAVRLDDEELRACQSRAAIKALLLRRHEQWKQQCSLVVVQAPVCAASRTPVSLAQRGWTRKEVYGSIGLPGAERQREPQHADNAAESAARPAR